jgi:glycosyltransferase involved in cell wall biosynthesis
MKRVVRWIRRGLHAVDRAAYRGLAWRALRVARRDGDPRHVCLLVGSLGLGGTQKQIVGLAGGLRARGFRCTILVIDRVGPFFEPDALSGGADVACFVPAAGIPSFVFRLSTRLLGPPSLAFTALLAGTALRRLRPGVLQCFLDDANAIGALGGRLAGIPFVSIGLRSLHPDDRPWHGRAPSRAYRALDSRLVDRLVANSGAGLASFLRNQPGFPAQLGVVVRNGVARAEGRGPRAAGAPVILWLGRIAPEKRPDVFISALTVLRNQGTEFQVRVAGAGPAEDSMRTAVKAAGLSDRVRFMGAVRDVAGELDAASVLASASDVEGVPNAILEAMARGCPVVATDAGGVGEVVRAGETGLLVRPGAGGALAAAIGEALARRAEAEERALRARELVRASFGMERMVDEMLGAWKRSPAGERAE